MSKLDRQQAASVLEDRVTKIVKAMQVLIKDAPKIADVLDEEARLKTEAFLQSHFQIMMRELALAADFSPVKTAFSLNAPIAELPKAAIKPQKAPAEQELADIVSELDDDENYEDVDDKPTPSIPQRPKYVGPDEAPVSPTAPPTAHGRPWRKPAGRLVGTKQPIWDDHVETPKAAGDLPTEKPDHTGFIADAGFIDA